MRIVSLLPSSTEMICSLGLREQLVGVTHECDHPASVSALPKVTRTSIPHDAGSLEIDRLVRSRLRSDPALYSLDMEVLGRLDPDLIVTQALCDVCAVAENEVREAALSLPGAPRIINLEPTSPEDVLAAIGALAEATDRVEEGKGVVAALAARIDAVRRRTASEIPVEGRPRVVFLEWIDPPFSAGHWIPEMIEWAGGVDCSGNRNGPSRTIGWEAVVEARPEVLLIACCGMDLHRTLQDLPVLKARVESADLPCVRDRRVHVFDGNAYFSRPGPRLVDSLEILAHTLHPDIHPLPDGLPEARTVR